MSGGAIPPASRTEVRAKTSGTRLPVSVPTFLQALGLIYCLAFTSFGVQAAGLIGSRGILPFQEYLEALRAAAGTAAWREAPTLLWLHPTDGALAAVWIAGSVCSVLAIFVPYRRASASKTGLAQRLLLAACLLLWLSLCSVGQDFLSFQWDILLCEAGFLALFADDSRVRIWLFRWLLFRLMFFSGVVKLTSGDPTWRNLTAMHYHYETQPLPNPLSWYVWQQPLWAARAETIFTFAVELGVPFLFFGPRRARRAAAFLTAGLQILILATGNFAYFNFLAIALCLWLLIEPSGPLERSAWHKAVTACLAALIGIASGLVSLGQLELPLPPAGGAILHAIDPFHIVNGYGLFAVMTTERPEILVEGSADGDHWQAYEFRYKPGDLRRPPPLIAPAQPRLDWQMWFAALGSYQSNRWFVSFLLRLLQGEPAVLRLLQYNPFPHAPPRYIRARLFLYHFTTWGSRDWWWREEKGVYFPAASLR
ncbi:MAG TPA: lipase maturation factor family protein [Bryobacteraceae bacterium]|nr:lipase maturation factor family protein [Bryobacteraceae bacterium]